MTTRLENLLGALGVAINDRMDDAFDEVCAVGDSAPAALILIRENPDTRIEALARYLTLSHSGTVRLVDRLAQAGWVAREACEDKRAVVLVLTKAGEKVAERLLEGRRKSLGTDTGECRRPQGAGAPSAADAQQLGDGPGTGGSHLPVLRFRRLRTGRLPPPRQLTAGNGRLVNNQSTAHHCAA